MLSKKIEQELNNQIGMESNASASYLAMASWCDGEGLEGCAAFLYRQSDEERMHMLKLVHYVNEMGGKAVISEVAKPLTDYPSVQKLFNMVYEQEQAVSKSIFNLYEMAEKVRDYSTTSE